MVNMGDDTEIPNVFPVAQMTLSSLFALEGAAVLFYEVVPLPRPDGLCKLFIIPLPGLRERHECISLLCHFYRPFPPTGFLHFAGHGVFEEIITGDSFKVLFFVWRLAKRYLSGFSWVICIV